MILTTVCLSSNRSDIGHVAEFPLAVKKTASMYSFQFILISDTMTEQ